MTSSFLQQFEHLPLEALKSATKNFAEDHRIGEGGSSKVYKGEVLLSKGLTTVALKRLKRTYGPQDAEFFTNILMHSRYGHENILSLLGFCDEHNEKILVYEYASNKSLNLHLDSKDLTWVQRLSICIGAARGLEYLHDPAGTQQRLIHRNIKSSKILLDEDWNPMIGSLVLSKIGPANTMHEFLIEEAVGTPGYCDPHYVETRMLTKESDVYSFGVVLFEVLCGRLCLLRTNSPEVKVPITKMVQKHYENNKLNEIIWVGIKDEINPGSLKAFATIAYQCLNPNHEKRPSMKEVVTNLENARTYQIYAEGTKISLRDIQLATNYFATNNCIGEGGFGKVYLGELAHSEGYIMTVAVKRLHLTNDPRNRGFKNERNLSRYRNGNIVNLLGYCDDDNEKILVYCWVYNKAS